MNRLAYAFCLIAGTAAMIFAMGTLPTALSPDGQGPSAEEVQAVTGIVFFLFVAAIFGFRAVDMGMSKWSFLIMLVPFVNVLFLFLALFAPSAKQGGSAQSPTAA